MIATASTLLDATTSAYGLIAIGVFTIAYLLVISEDLTKLRKSKPVLAAAGLMWILVALFYNGLAHPPAPTLEQRLMHHVAEFGALFMFLMVAMTYITAISQHNLFLKINAMLVSAGLGFRAVFWVTGVLSFLISPIADNLTTALLMGAVVVTVGQGNKRFISLACINVVVAANAGGAFSPFGDITTLLVWQMGKVPTQEFSALVLPSLVNWLVPAAIMHFAVPRDKPAPLEAEVHLVPGWQVITGLFLCTIATAVVFHAVLHLPPFLGMTTGLGYFFAYGHVRRLREHRLGHEQPIDVFHHVREVEWDTLLFFFGVIICVGALSELGYLAAASTLMYDPAGPIGPYWANVSVGILSAVIDNVPVMFAVLRMDPVMAQDPAGSLYQWLLVTLSAGVGGSLLSVGSAAGVALMGTAPGTYTFVRHLKWTPVIALGFAASIATHAWLNAPEPVSATDPAPAPSDPPRIEAPSHEEPGPDPHELSIPSDHRSRASAESR